ncbi:MAG: DUF1990 family protein [Mycobacteriales bacterium]
MAVERLPAAVMERLGRLELSYPEVGATAGTLPAGYRHLLRRRVIGVGPEPFAAAGEVLMAWRMHQRCGLRPAVSAERAEPGAVVVLRMGFGPVAVTAPCRVVAVVEEPSRVGFTYGTLPGHPERGEEAFLIEHHDSGVVTATVVAFSRPASTLARLGGPLARLIQTRTADRYLRALEAPPTGTA